MITDLNKESKIALDIFNAKVIRKASLKKEKPFKNTITKKTSEEICSSTYVCTKYQLVFEDCPPYEVCIFDTQNECWWETVCYNDSYSFLETPLYDPYNCYDNPGTPWCKEACNDCGDGSGGQGNQPNTIVIVAPDYPIQDIIDYLKCFNNNQSAKITFYADQPQAGSSKSNTWFGDVGHAFITIEQNGNRMTLGFYPASGGVATLNSLLVPVNGVMGNDTSHHYDVSLSVNVSGSILTSILNESVNYAGATYNINTNNCSDFAISVANIAGLNISDCNGPFGLGSFGIGSNPGAFGEELRNMTLSGGMTKDNDGGSAPQNIKNCN
jgi:hypothetical protein